MKKSILVSLIAPLMVAVTASALAETVGDIRVFLARKIITMEPALPEATAVAVADGRIVSVGDLDSLQPWLKDRDVVIDRRFEDKVLMPGFIDPHVHPSLPAVLTQYAFLAPDDWSVPTGDFPGATDPRDYEKKLKALAADYFADPDRDPGIPFIAWGFHQLWHGDVYRPQLDEWFPEQPVLLWHRSFHEVIANTAALELLGVTEADVADNHEIDWEKGHFWELGAKVLIGRPSMAFLFAPERYARGMANFIQMLRQAGVTSALDMGIGIFGNASGEIAMIQQAMEAADAPARVVLTPIITDFLARQRTPEQALQEITEWTSRSSDKALLDNHFKLMMDGAAFSGLGQFHFPGYIDGHEGVWMAPLEVTYRWAEFFWNRGFQLHAHTNGDKSAGALIDTIRRLQAQHPRSDHRTTLEHFLFANEDQVENLAALGVAVSANPYYQYLLSDIYSDQCSARIAPAAWSPWVRPQEQGPVSRYNQTRRWHP